MVTNEWSSMFWGDAPTAMSKIPQIVFLPEIDDMHTETTNNSDAGSVPANTTKNIPYFELFQYLIRRQEFCEH